MTIARTFPVLLAGLLIGCGDKQPTDVATRKVALEIQVSSLPAEEETLPVGGTLQLSAVVKQGNGKAAEDPAPVQWSSTQPAVAEVNASGLVTAVQVGTAQIVARASGHSDTVRVNVADLVSGAVACQPGQQPVSLAVGQVLTTTADRATTLCVAGGASGAEYTLIPFNASQVAGSRLTVDFAAAGVSPVTGPPSPSRVPDAAPQEREGPLPDQQFHDHFRERTGRALERKLAATSGLLPAPPRPATAPSVGQMLPLNVETASKDGCSTPDRRTGRVVAVTARTVVVADTANPREGFTDAEYRSFGEAFDTLVWRVATHNFGEPSDVDENGRVILFFTRAVNEMTKANARSYVGGFFFNRDLFPVKGDNACAGSNHAELFYLMVPDPSGVVNGNSRSVNFVRNNTVGVLGHEFQHLINDSRRLYVNRAPVWEEVWLNEGLSHIAEELLFYEAADLGPERNLGGEQLRDAGTARAFNLYQADNIQRLIDYLRNPQSATLMGVDELPTRGASWSFLRYAADRVPGQDDASVWKGLANSTTQGLENLRQVLGVNPRDWMQDWTVSVYVDDAGLEVQDRYRQPSWNLRSLIPTLRGETGSVRYSRYPLYTTPLRAEVQTQHTLQGGGTTYLRFGVPSGASAAIRTTVKGLPAPSRLRLSLVRTK